MLIVNVAEKPSVAKSIANIFSNSVEVYKGQNKYCLNHKFIFKNNNMIFTSVLGHMYEFEFPSEYKNWNTINPKNLFTAKIYKKLKTESIYIKKNIEDLSINADLVVIWTDCDREGENIGKQIQSLVYNKKVKRARFSAISKHEILKAFDNLCDINQYESDAVEARQEIDLRIGCAFTVLQTLALQKTLFFNSLSAHKIISYGQCQIPTLNFVVQRHKEIVSFIPEKFYSISIINKSNEFLWNRGHIFDKNCVLHFYNQLISANFIVTDIIRENKVKYKPLPLRTVELQKVCTTYYKISSHEIMDIAEKLYNQGYISYPRTETDVFPNNFDFNRIIGKLRNDTQFKEYLEKFTLKFPRNGNNNDQAHSPIYPLKDGNMLKDKERNIYDFIARRFIACCDDNAKGVEVVIKIRPFVPKSSNILQKNIEQENFYCKGLIILERNYLNIYFYDKWNAKEIIGKYNVNDIIQKANIEIKDGMTTCPEYLTEKDLITLMDKNEIGTDATIHEHIEKIQIRNYAIKQKQYIKPTIVGINLINAYSQLKLPLSECSIRKDMEKNLKRICSGQLSKNALVKEQIDIYSRMFDKFQQNINDFVNIMQTNVEKNTSELYNKYSLASNHTNNTSSNILCWCKQIAVKKQVSKGKNRGKWFYSCYTFPVKCDFFIWEGDKIPLKKVRYNEIIDTITCDCGKPVIQKISNTTNNKGRKFYLCNKAYKKCKFFQWAD